MSGYLTDEGHCMAVLKIGHSDFSDSETTFHRHKHLAGFYRSKNDAGLKLLEHVEQIKDKVIITYQVELEFKGNRQDVLKVSWSNLKPPNDVERPNVVADAKTTKMLRKNIEDAKRRVEGLRKKLEKVIAQPTVHDPVYQAFQRIFHRDDGLVLKRDNPVRHQIRRRAYKRFLHGCPP
jgi:hypothetical protein